MASTSLKALLSADIPDPSDFPETASGLRRVFTELRLPGYQTRLLCLLELDGALNCDVCANTYDGPVSLPCGHTFCSVVRLIHVASKCVRN